MLLSIVQSMRYRHGHYDQSGFTLIELLVVIAIIAVLSVVVILLINPAEQLKQSRDANRVADMVNLNTALSVYAEDQSSGSLGSSNVVYVSIPDSTATSTAGDQCQGLGLPTLPTNYTYHCAATSTLRNIDGTGWIPVVFSNVSIGSPLSQLPVDPANVSSSRFYYTYTTNGTQFEVTAPMESAKYKLGGAGDIISGDGGTLASVYEKGSKLGLEPLDYGDNSLVGLWTMDEGTGTTLYDYSGQNATGTWTGSSAYYSSSARVGSYAGNFDGSTNYATISNLPYTKSLPFSVAAWINPKTGSSSGIFNKYISSSWNGFNLFIQSNTLVSWYLRNMSNYVGISQQGGVGSVSGYPLPTSTWTFAVVTVSNSGMQMYINGSLYTSASWTGSAGVTTESTPITFGIYSGSYSGLIDDVRIYNRALGAAEIAAMYAGGK